MKYIVMCGRGYIDGIPKQMIKLGGDTIVGRTIRLLKKWGAEDIAISTNNEAFKEYNVPLLHHNNEGDWVNGFYPMEEPVCYIMGDVIFSDYAINTIIHTDTDRVQFFASAPPFGREYPKKWAEPFAFKVQDTKYFFDCIQKVKEGIAAGLWNRHPVSWELWQVIKGTAYNVIDYTNYCVINDFTCDLDYENEIYSRRNYDLGVL